MIAGIKYTLCSGIVSPAILLISFQKRIRSSITTSIRNYVSTVFRLKIEISGLSECNKKTIVFVKSQARKKSVCQVRSFHAKCRHDQVVISNSVNVLKFQNNSCFRNYIDTYEINTNNK